MISFSWDISEKLDKITGARIYENLLPFLVLRGPVFNSIKKKFEKITANEKMKILTKVIHRKSIFLILDLNFFFRSLNSRTFDILKHVSRSPRPKITEKS